MLCSCCFKGRLPSRVPGSEGGEQGIARPTPQEEQTLSQKTHATRQRSLLPIATETHLPSPAGPGAMGDTKSLETCSASPFSGPENLLENK